MTIKPTSQVDSIGQDTVGNNFFLIHLPDPCVLNPNNWSDRFHATHGPVERSEILL